MEQDVHFLYVLHSDVADRYYVGVTSDPELRLRRHNTTSRGFTARHRPWKLVYQQAFPTKSEALSAERRVKSWKSKKMVAQLIDGEVSVE